jgi:hypothetical protein
MTQPSAFQRAAAQAAQSAAPTSPAPAGGSSLMDDDGNGGSSLFGGESLSSLFNKFVVTGEKRTGIIVEPPRDKQSYDIAGKPKFWDNDARKVVNHDTGRPLMDTLIILDTEYRFTPQEIGDRNIDPLDVEEDKGRRGLFASGDMKAAIKKAIKAARVRTEKEMVGMRLTIWRTGKVKKGEFDSWTYEATLERA